MFSSISGATRGPLRWVPHANVRGVPVIIGGPTAPPGPFPEIEVETGRNESNEIEHFRKAVKKTD